MANTAIKPSSKHAAFIDYVFSRCEADKGMAARLKRADNPSTEYQSWELLGSFGVALEFKNVRLPYVTIAAAIAKSEAKANGALTLGVAIAQCFEEGAQSKQASVRLRRLLACSDTTELCQVLRPLISLIESRVEAPLNFERLLRQLTSFWHDPQKVKATWAQEFYRQLYDEKKQEVQA